MSGLILTPTVTANEDTLILSQWYKDDGAFVRKGEVLCGVETSKATVDIEADQDGYLSRLTDIGATTKVGTAIAAITDSVNDDVQALIDGPAAETDTKKKWTKKAAIVAKRLNIDIEKLSERSPSTTITEADVLAAQDISAEQTQPAAPTVQSTAPTQETQDIFESAYPNNQPERVLLLGGGAGAGAMSVDVLARTHKQRAVGILDGNAATHGKTVGGVSVIGTLDLVEELWGEGAFDAAVILFTQDVDERAEVYNELRRKGVRFTNIIDPTVDIRGGTTFGEGNLIMANAFFSTAVTVGNNCFFASHCVIEHHSKIGNHCAFGPRTTTSGAVVVGDRVKTGMSVSIEPYITVGANSLIASGSMITSDVPENSLIKSKQTHNVQAKQGTK
ncbi:MAG: hypothetical protein GKS01_06230 [Alphaproteobacteria bacterium]|nr:hypothetical protein [Alphaproteobacteria bacterium]